MRLVLLAGKYATVSLIGVGTRGPGRTMATQLSAKISAKIAFLTTKINAAIDSLGEEMLKNVKKISIRGLDFSLCEIRV